MDRQTLAAYDQAAAAYADDWLGQPAPVDLQEIVERFFVRGGNSADIGCGCGREVAWLHANGFSAVGFDASEGLLKEARRASGAGTDTETVKLGLEALLRRAAYERLRTLRGSEPRARDVPRRREPSRRRSRAA
jgi:2-polyprenyl-3-methyl-5-hydroxy-6-metoxy-1,4-benzoquinol methylase